MYAVQKQSNSYCIAAVCLSVANIVRVCHMPKRLSPSYYQLATLICMSQPAHAWGPPTLRRAHALALVSPELLQL